MYCAIAGCAGPNPNPGERSADIHAEHQAYGKALEIVQPRAEAGEPWAQLRMGLYCESGVGVEKSELKAIQWYKKVAVRKRDTMWADGYIVGATGPAGYFGENTDALIAQWQMAGLYLEGEEIPRDLTKAYLLMRNVEKEAKGASVFFCCEWSGGRYVTTSAVQERIARIKATMDPKDFEEAKRMAASWDPQSGL